MSDSSMYGEGSMSQTTVTAFFDDRLEAETAAERLRSLGMGLKVRITEGAGDDASVSGGGDDRGFFEKLGDFLFPDDDRSTYAEGLSRGGHLLVVSGVGDDSLDLVMDELESAGAVDIDERAESWRSEGWSVGQTASGGSSLSTGASLAGATTASDISSEGTVPVVEERLLVGKRDVSHGRVRVRSYVVEEPVSETVRLASEHVEVERRAVDRPVSPGDTDLFRDRTLEAEEFREEAVVSKEARVVEEVGLRRTRETHEETVSDTLRRTEVEVGDERGMSSDRTTRRPLTEEEAETGLPRDESTDRNRR